MLAGWCDPWRILKSLLSRVSPDLTRRLRTFGYAAKKRLIDTFFAYGVEEIESCLHHMGVERGNTIMVHSSFNPMSGFRGPPGQLVQALLNVVGPTGNILMVSLPYTSSTHEYLKTAPHFDVRKTLSRMGLVSETFRRRADVIRSLSPTHPVLALGPKASWIVAGHEDCLYPCGPGSPFEKLAQLDGKVVFFGVPFETFTFFHYLEHQVRNEIGFPLYFSAPADIPVMDYQGKNRIIRSYVFSSEAISRRRLQILIAELNRRHSIRKKRVGNTRILLVKTSEAIRCTEEMTKSRIFFYDSV